MEHGEQLRSGMGFELTFRLLKTPKEVEDQQQRPPTWPANLLQSIARYCFQTGNTLCVGDNIPWKRSLDGTSNSKIQNILVAQDAQLGCLDTPFGMVDFCQIVGYVEKYLYLFNCIYIIDFRICINNSIN